MDKAAIWNIQRSYLDTLDGHFMAERKAIRELGGDVDGYLKQQGRSCTDFVVPRSGGVQAVRDFRIRAFLNDLQRFWTQNEQKLFAAISDAQGLALAIWGDSDIDVITPVMGLYFD